MGGSQAHVALRMTTMNFPVSSRHLVYGSSLFALLLVIPLTFCSKASAPKRYELGGRVVAVDPSNRQLTIAHQEIPGLMKAMTMPFTVSKSGNWIFHAIAPGDHIHARLVQLHGISSYL